MALGVVDAGSDERAAGATVTQLLTAWPADQMQ
jgi:hypothetical protein